MVFFQCYKLSVKKVTNDAAATILLQVIAGVSVLALVPFLPVHIPTDGRVLLLLAAACVFYAVNDRLQMTARKHLEVSTFSIINQFSTVFLIVYGLVIFREPFVLTKLIGAALIIFANVLILYKPKKHRVELNRYSVIAILASLAFATAISIDINVSKEFNLPIYISLTLLLPAILIGLSGRTKPTAPLAELKQGNPKLFLITGVAWALTIFFSLRAFKLGAVNVIVPLEAAAVILNVLVAYIFLKERDKPYRKIAGACLVILGVLLTVR